MNRQNESFLFFFYDYLIVNSIAINISFGLLTNSVIGSTVTEYLVTDPLLVGIISLTLLVGLISLALQDLALSLYLAFKLSHASSKGKAFSLSRIIAVG